MAPEQLGTPTDSDEPCRCSNALISWERVHNLTSFNKADGIQPRPRGPHILRQNLTNPAKHEDSRPMCTGAKRVEKYILKEK
jgi:hypothetical protein